MGTRHKNKGHENLRPAKKGEVRNPKGGEKGVPTFKTIYAKILEGTMTIQEAGKRKKMTRREVLAMQRMKDAMDPKNTANERTRAGESVENRVEGKPFQPLTGPEGLPLEPPIINVKFVDGNEDED